MLLELLQVECALAVQEGHKALRGAWTEAFAQELSAGAKARVVVRCDNSVCPSDAA